MRLERTLGVVAGGLTLVLVLTLLTTRAAPTSPGPDRAAARSMVAMVNEVRDEHGLDSLDHAEDVAAVAVSWSATMATDGYLRHNPTYGEEVCCWERVTENVAFSDPHRLWRPGDPVERITAELHDALLGSESHRANILDPQVDQIGVGVYVHTDGSVWITQNFRLHHPR